MKLGAIIKAYREENGLSLRDFAKKSGVSNSYLSMLETGRQPQSGRPIVPTLTVLNKIAVAMNLRIDDLISSADDMTVLIKDSSAPATGNYTDLEKSIIMRFRSLSVAEKNLVLRSLGLSELSDNKKESYVVPEVG